MGAVCFKISLLFLVFFLVYQLFFFNNFPFVFSADREKFIIDKYVKKEFINLNNYDEDPVTINLVSPKNNFII